MENTNKSNVAKVPVIMQMEALECGAACLTMILAYYKLFLPLEQVRRDCGVSRDGSNARNILKAARSYGMEANGYRYELEGLLANVQVPCIVHWNFNHFIVLKGIKGDKVYVNDPAKGSVVMSIEDFDKGFTGICIMMKPTEAFVPGGKPKSILGFTKKRLAGAEGALIFVALTTLISSLIALIRAGFSRVLLDQLLPGYQPDWLIPFTVLLAVVTILQIAISWVNSVNACKISGKLAAVGETSYMWSVFQLPMEFFSQRLAGDIQQRKSTNAGIAAAVVNTLAPIALNMIMIVFYLVVMLRYSPLLTMIGVTSSVINIFLSFYISQKRVNISRVMMRDQGKLSAATVSGIEMIETIKSSGAENGYFRKWAGYQASVNTQKTRFARMNQYLGMIPTLVQQLAAVSVLLTGTYLVIKGKFTVGMIMAFQGHLSSFTAPVQQLIGSGQTIQEMRTDMERIEDVMAYPTDAAPSFKAGEMPEEGVDKLSGAIEMKNVTFGYSPLGAPLIENFSMKMEPGSRVAFVGSSGCGKSTLAKLISGLYQPWSGEILFDGKPIKEIDRDIFTGSIAVVDQDIILFEDTIANNIRMWDKSLENYEVIIAAKDAQIHDDIVQREGGYNYKIHAGGTDFSGGQRQRIEIARVLAQDPTIIVMDEATSALDAKTEFEVVESIKQRGITCIVIAHRLSTIRDCDEIVVLDHGKVVERGTHEELMKKNGAYTKLVVSE